MMHISDLRLTDLWDELCMFIDEAGADLVNTPAYMFHTYGDLLICNCYWCDEGMFDILNEGFLFWR